MRVKTLKARIDIFATIFCLTITLISSSIMYTIVSNEMDSRMKDAYISNLNQIRIAIENNLKNLSSLSQLFTNYGGLAEDLMLFNQIGKLSQKAILLNKIKTDMGIIVFSNPNIGLCATYPFKNEDGYLSSAIMKENFNVKKLPVLLKLNQMTYYGPHISNDRYSNKLVISSIRQINIGYDEPTYVYAETYFDITERILDADLIPKGVSHLIIDSNEKIVYSSSNKKFVVDQTFNLDEQSHGVFNGYNWYKSKSNQGWSILTIIDRSKVNEVKLKLLTNYILLFPIFLFLSILFSWILFGIIKKPMQAFKKGIVQIGVGDFDSLIEKTNIYEFDILIAQIHKAKLKINELLIEVQEKEMKRSIAEINRLRSQINPHFLLNTLNTAHWLAITKKQPEIDNIILSLNKILSYNLRKDSYVATISEELEATENYLKLQKLRCDFEYKITNHCGGEALDYQMPRFILQPLVENSILHSTNNDLKIDVILDYSGTSFMLKVKDNGGGIEQEKLKSINSCNTTPENLGIGLSYVIATVNAYYKKENIILFENVDGGVEVTILLLDDGVGFDDKCTSS